MGTTKSKSLLVFLVIGIILASGLAFAYIFKDSLWESNTSLQKPSANNLNSNKTTLIERGKSFTTYVKNQLMGEANQEESVSTSGSITLLDQSQTFMAFIPDDTPTTYLESLLPLTNNGHSFSQLQIIVTDTPQPLEEAWLNSSNSREVYSSYSLDISDPPTITLNVFFDKIYLQKYNWSPTQMSGFLQLLAIQALTSLQRNQSFDVAREDSISKSKELSEQNVRNPFVIIYDQE